MKELLVRRPVWLGLVLFLFFVLACSASTSKPASTSVAHRVETASQTSSYVINLAIGPKVTMPASAMTIAMATTDQGHPVNRHLEVHVFNKSSGARITDMIPTVSIADKATGSPRTLASVLACMTLKHREIEPHFGDNLYMTDGGYTVTVSIGDESASFNVSL